MVELNEQITLGARARRQARFVRQVAGRCAGLVSISRNRFCRAPPSRSVQSDNPDYPRTDVYGSLDSELERDFGVRPASTLHRPAIDDLVRPNPDDPTGQSLMRRVPEGARLLVQSRGRCRSLRCTTRFENREWFDSHYPGVTSSSSTSCQTRGWFYTLHVLATRAVRPARLPRSCVGHGFIVLGNDGQKMSKSLRNYPDVNRRSSTPSARTPCAGS